MTEVHHINGEGEDAGVVYSEMQGRENTGESRTHLEMLRAMFPENSGYRFETGGILENIRNSTCHAKVHYTFIIDLFMNSTLKIKSFCKNKF